MLKGFLEQQTPPMVGIDIGSNSIKAVLLSKTTDGFRLDGVAQMPVPKGAVVDHEIQDIEAVGGVIKTLRKRFDRKVRLAAAAVSGSSVMTKVIFMDAALSDNEMEEQIRIEADNLIPYALDEVSLDFETIGPNRADPTKADVLLTASRTENVEARVSALEEGNFSAKVIDVEAYALGRSVELMVAQLEGYSEKSVTAVVDIGSNMTTFSFVVDGQIVYTREQAFGGEQFTQSLMSYYGMEHAEAETAKLTGELPRNYTFEVLAPFQTSLIQQLRRTIQIFSTSSGYDKVDNLILAGGTAQLEGIVQLLSDELGVETIVANPFSGMTLADEIAPEAITTDAAKYAVACGLALRSFSQWHI
ncbi:MULTISPECIES: pilus assembly protein PilM [Corallincola]|nr:MULTISPECIES: pilus assembly protein PilM [Corallincola]